MTPQPIFLHVREMMGIILGLAIATLLTGMFEFRTQRKASRTPFLHIGWSVVMVIECAVFWWWEFRLTLIPTWNFGKYAFVLGYAMLFYVLARVLYPSDLAACDDHDDYFLRNRRWFFGLLLLSLVADLWDTHIKGAAYMHELGARYFIHNGFGAVVCVAGALSARRGLQWLLLLSTLAYEIAYVVVIYRHV